MNWKTKATLRYWTYFMMKWTPYVDFTAPFIRKWVRKGYVRWTTFLPLRVQKLYDMFPAVMNPAWIRWSGSRCTYRVFDVHITTLTVLKNGVTSDVVAAAFKVKSSTFQRICQNSWILLVFIHTQYWSPTFLKSLIWIKWTIVTICSKVTQKHYTLAM